MKIRSSFLFACMAISVVLGGASPASATSTEIDHGTAICMSTVKDRISDPNEYRWMLLGNGAYEDVGCDFSDFDNYKFASWCNNLENRPFYDELCNGEQALMITTSDLDYIQKNSDTNEYARVGDCLRGIPGTEWINGKPYSIAVFNECYTTRSKLGFLVD